METNNAAPLEVYWFVTFMIAFGNFGTELRQCLRDLKALNMAARRSLLLPAEVGSRKIEVHRFILTQLYMMAACFFFAVPGLFLMFQPGSGENGEPSPSAIFVSSCMATAGTILFLYSCTVRVYSRLLRANLLFRKRSDDPPDAIDHLLRKEGELMGTFIDGIVHYKLKGVEVFWSLVIPGAAGLVGFLTDFRPETVDNWKLWLMLLAGATIRPIIAASAILLTKLSTSGDSEPPSEGTPFDRRGTTGL